MTPDGWTVVFESGEPRAASERALVLTSLGIAHDVLRGEDRYLLVVPDEDRHRARHEIYLYERENRTVNRPRGLMLPAAHDPWPGIVGYLLVLCALTWAAGQGLGGHDWLGAGRVDGELIRDGHWWRIFTALTLHRDFTHLAGNLGFGALFGGLAARVIGPGVTWLTVALTAGLANLVNTLLLIPAHRSIGASTAVFAALGLVAGFVWRGRLMAQDRWQYRLGPIVGGFALLAYTGTGDESTDIGAHLAGFVCGFAGGILLTRFSGTFASARLQLACGVAAPAVLAAAWWLALR